MRNLTEVIKESYQHAIALLKRAEPTPIALEAAIRAVHSERSDCWARLKATLRSDEESLEYRTWIQCEAELAEVIVPLAVHASRDELEADARSLLELRPAHLSRRLDHERRLAGNPDRTQELAEVQTEIAHSLGFADVSEYHDAALGRTPRDRAALQELVHQLTESVSSALSIPEPLELFESSLPQPRKLFRKHVLADLPAELLAIARAADDAGVVHSSPDGASHSSWHPGAPLLAITLGESGRLIDLRNTCHEYGHLFGAATTLTLPSLQPPPAALSEYLAFSFELRCADQLLQTSFESARQYRTLHAERFLWELGYWIRRCKGQKPRAQKRPAEPRPGYSADYLLGAAGALLADTFPPAAKSQQALIATVVARAPEVAERLFARIG